MNEEVKTSKHEQNPPVEKRQSQTRETLPQNLAELEAAMEAGYNLEAAPEHASAAVPGPSRLATELRAVMDAVAQFTYQDGKPCICYPGLLIKIMKIASFYGKNGFQVGAELHRAWTHVQRSPSTAPEFPHWFLAVVEARFKRSRETRKAASAEAGKAAMQAVGASEGEWAGDLTRTLLDDLKRSSKLG